MSGMKVYLTDEKELIMEPSIKWAGNPNVTVAVKAFGLKASVQVIGLVYCARKNLYYLCVCVCVCACVRERERESFTASLHCLVSMISGGGFCKYLLLHVQWRMIKGTRGGPNILKNIYFNI